jgi:acetylornithine deacetylase/succinyl-diaminopimelate desuccinylase-like protein
MKRRSLLIIALFLSIPLLISAQSEIPTQPKASYKDEMKLLLKHKKVVEAFKIIDQLEPLTVKDHIFLTEIPAPPFKEKERGVVYKKMLEEAGADQVWIDSVGNVLAMRKGKKGTKTIALDAHLDTVFPDGTDVKVKHKGDTLLAPGILDDTRGLAVVLTVLRALEKAGIETKENILIVGSVGEEGPGDLRGVKALFKKGAMPIDSWISADGGGGTIGGIVNAAVGSIRYRVTVKGPGGHSWGSFGLGNPHHLLGRAIHYFDEDASIFVTQGIKTSYNVGRIGGGTSINSIPFESWMEVDMRSEDPDRLKEINAIFLASIEKAKTEYNQKIKQGPPLTVEIKQIGFRPSGKTDVNDPLIQRSLAAANYFKEETVVVPESTNSNIPISKGTPAVTLNLGGNGGNPHSLNEWWVNDKGSDAIKMIMLVLLSQTGID